MPHPAWLVAIAWCPQVFGQGQGDEITTTVSIKHVVTKVVTIDGPPSPFTIAEVAKFAESDISEAPCV